MKRARGDRPADCPYVSKGGLKLAFALDHFNLSAAECVAADFGCHKGGFTDCLLQHGAARVHAVDTGYGVLEWKLRNDPRVAAHERANFLHWQPPEPLDLVVIDGGWTPQRLSVPAALRALKATGRILSLVKPQYEADRKDLVRGVLPEQRIEGIMRTVRDTLQDVASIRGEVLSPVAGSGGNREVWLLLAPPECGDNPKRSE